MIVTMTRTADDELTTRIVDVADALYYVRGYSAVGMDAVRDAAGVSLRRLYQLFASKEELVLAVLARRRARWTVELEARLAAASTGRDRLLALYDYLADWFGEDGFRGCGFINAFGELGGTSPAIASAVRGHKEGFQQLVATLAAEAGASPALAPQLALLAEGAQTTAAIAGTTEAAGHARAAASILIDADLATVSTTA
jgi:AcrR family transcriptional regulator